MPKDYEELSSEFYDKYEHVYVAIKALRRVADAHKDGLNEFEGFAEELDDLIDAMAIAYNEEEEQYMEEAA